MYVFATHFNECTTSTNYIFVVHSFKWVAKTYSWQVFHRVAILSELNFPKILTFFMIEWQPCFQRLYCSPRRGCSSHFLYDLSRNAFSVISCSSLPSRTSGTSGPSIDICISWQTWSGSRRQRWLQRIRFIVEKERSTVAVPTGSRSSSRTAVENAGNMATLSAESARFSILPVVSRSPGRRLRIFHSDCKSVTDTAKWHTAGACFVHCLVDAARL